MHSIEKYIRHQREDIWSHNKNNKIIHSTNQQGTQSWQRRCEKARTVQNQKTRGGIVHCNIVGNCNIVWKESTSVSVVKCAAYFPLALVLAVSSFVNHNAGRQWDRMVFNKFVNSNCNYYFFECIWEVASSSLMWWSYQVIIC